MEQFAKETLPVSLEEEMRRSYLDYAMSVIVGRALPDVRDGLKPVHRRVLFAMHEANNVWNRPYVKCARVVGEVLGKYHPHGDAATYEALVRMAQDFSMRYPLIDGQGNFGSIDGDSAAAYRYTECRLDRIASEILADIEKETVDFAPNYDGKEREPSALPTKVPNLLINGSSGIAVGMATNIPPHNLGEVVDACQALLKKPEIGVDELIKAMPAPDFPTAGIIYGVSGVREGYRTGRGRIVLRARTHFEDLEKGNRQAIIVDELPYQVNKKTLLERIAELVNDKKIEGIAHVQDESDKSGMRVVIELKRGEIPEVILNNLFKQTQLQDTFGVNMVALLDGQPRLLNLKEMLQAFLAHRREVVTRRTLYDLREARKKAHIQEGLAVALSNVDEIIELIKKSQTPPEAKVALMAKAWRSPVVEEMLKRAAADASRPEELGREFGLQKSGYRLSDAQAQAILEMRLQRLTGLEQSEIVEQAEDLQMEDLIASEDVVVTFSHAGYIKSQPLTDYRAQRRGGRGKQAATTKEDDVIERLFIANTHDTMLCFSSRGRVYWLKVYNVPQGTRASRGKPIVNLFPLSESEKINAVLPVKEYDDKHFVFLATSLGTVKKTPLSQFSNPREKGIISVELDDGDHLIGAAITEGKHDVMLFSVAGSETLTVLTATENGFGKRTPISDYTRHGRGTQGMIAIQVSERNGKLVGAVLVGDEDEIMLISTGGVLIRMRVKQIREMGRSTQGVRLIDLDEGTKLAGVECVAEKEEEEENGQ